MSHTNMETYFGDTKTKYNRMGYSNLYKTIARAFILGGIITVTLLGLATMFTNYATSVVQARDTIENIRYQNIKK